MKPWHGTENKRREEKRVKNNKNGNAALVAVLIMIILIGIGAIVMMLGGRNDIKDTDDNPQEKKNNVVTTTTTAATAPVPETPKEVDLYLKQSPDFKKTDIKGLTSQATLLADLDDDVIYAGSNMDLRIYPASLTKVLTVLVACENAKSYDDTYTFKPEDLAPLEEENASMAGFKPGEKVTIMDLLYGAVLPSGADACVGLENAIAGSKDKFMELMNKRIQELGLKNTHFTNTTGLHDEKHYTTLADMAVIMKVANHNVTCRKVLNTMKYTTAQTQQNPTGIDLQCTVLGRVSGFFIDKNGNGSNDDSISITGGKTGYTDEAGYAMATLAKDTDNGHTYCCIISKSSTAATCGSETVAMFEKYVPGSKAKVPGTADAAAPATTTAAAAAKPAA